MLHLLCVAAGNGETPREIINTVIGYFRFKQCIIPCRIIRVFFLNYAFPALKQIPYSFSFVKKNILVDLQSTCDGALEKTLCLLRVNVAVSFGKKSLFSTKAFAMPESIVFLGFVWRFVS